MAARDHNVDDAHHDRVGTRRETDTAPQACRSSSPRATAKRSRARSGPDMSVRYVEPFASVPAVPGLAPVRRRCSRGSGRCGTRAGEEAERSDSDDDPESTIPAVFHKRATNDWPPRSRVTSGRGTCRVRAVARWHVHGPDEVETAPARTVSPTSSDIADPRSRLRTRDPEQTPRTSDPTSR